MKMRSLFVFVLLCSSLACRGNGEPRIMPGVDACALCSMVITKANEACTLKAEGKWHTYDSPGCLLRAIEKRHSAHEGAAERILCADNTDGQLTPVENAAFLHTERVATVMGSGVLVFRDAVGAKAVAQGDDIVTDWLGYRSRKGRPHQTLALTLSPQGITPQTISARKGDLIELTFSGAGLTENTHLRVRGYEHHGDIVVSSDATPTSLRLLLTKPGQGFPIIRLPDDKPLAMLKVEGAHTADEAEEMP